MPLSVVGHDVFGPKLAPPLVLTRTLIWKSNCGHSPHAITTRPPGPRATADGPALDVMNTGDPKEMPEFVLRAYFRPLSFSSAHTRSTLVPRPAIVAPYALQGTVQREPHVAPPSVLRLTYVLLAQNPPPTHFCRLLSRAVGERGETR